MTPGNAPVRMPCWAISVAAIVSVGWGSSGLPGPAEEVESILTPVAAINAAVLKTRRPMIVYDQRPQLCLLPNDLDDQALQIQRFRHRDQNGMVGRLGPPLKHAQRFVGVQSGPSHDSQQLP